jgi:hypothetical protein
MRLLACMSSSMNGQRRSLNEALVAARMLASMRTLVRMYLFCKKSQLVLGACDTVPTMSAQIAAACKFLATVGMRTGKVLGGWLRLRIRAFVVIIEQRVLFVILCMGVVVALVYL